MVSEETRCRHMGYSFRLASRFLLYASSHRQDSTYHGLYYTSRAVVAGTKLLIGSTMRDRSENCALLCLYILVDTWYWTTQIRSEETRCRHMGYSFRLASRFLLYASSHRQDTTYHSLCYTSRGALAKTRNSSMGPPHEGSIRRPIAP